MRIAFIPARFGSKSIPQKNIKLFCGKPLIYWVLKAANDSNCINKVVLSTDSIEIENIACSFKLPKLEIFKRSPDTATDDATTESAMLDYFENSIVNFKSSDEVVLLQATSPFTTSEDIDRIVALKNNEFDSALSVVDYKRFLWKVEGPLNYDFNRRPRRQEMSSQYLENGAIYLNSISNLIKNKCRLYGKVGLYVMAEYTAVELDEIDDWHIAEFLFKRYALKNKYSNIKLVMSDIDGVLTDGGMYYSEKGDESKKFNTRDGMGFELLRNIGIKTALVTSENTEINQRRAEKLKIDYLIQGKKGKEKLVAALEICKLEGIDINEAAYIGDDINCKDLLEIVGLSACPSDAVSLVRQVEGIRILESKGGCGVFREFVEIILSEGLAPV